MPKRNPINRCCLSDKAQRELCLQCTLEDCDSSSAGCLIRRKVNELQRKQYWRDPQKSREQRRKKNIPPDQYEKKKAYMKRYYEENRDVILMKQQLRKQRNNDNASDDR